jgi:hypothetical protein
LVVVYFVGRHHGHRGHTEKASPTEE